MDFKKWLLKDQRNAEWIRNLGLGIRRAIDVFRDYFRENYKKGIKRK